MKNFLKKYEASKYIKKNEHVDTTGNASDSEKCSSRDDYVDIDKIGLNKCYGCDKDKLKEQANYISKDFN